MCVCVCVCVCVCDTCFPEPSLTEIMQETFWHFFNLSSLHLRHFQ